MLFHRRVRIFASTLLGAAVLKLAAPAAACSPPFCPPPLRFPPTAWMPGNLVYFKLLDDTQVELSLRTAAGEPIAASIRTIGNDRVFAPEEPIPAGTQAVLDYSFPCGAEARQHSFEFLADLHASIELQPAELQIVEQGIAYPGVPNDEASFVRLRHLSGDLNGAASALMTHTFTVDGMPARLGEVNSQQVVEVSASCNPSFAENQQDTCGTLYSVTPGVHTVEARTSIVGELIQPAPVHLAVEVRCPGDAADTVEPVPWLSEDPDRRARPTDSDTDLRTAALDTTGGDARGAQPDVGSAVSSSSSSGGCSLTPPPSRPASSSLAVGLGALLLMSTVARRRRRA